MSRRAALLTGGSSGIGLAIAHVLREEGHDVTISARRPDKLEAAAGRLREAAGPGAVETVVANLAEPAAAAELVAAHRERFGRLDVLVNNAGIGAGGPVAEQTDKALDLQIAVNLRAVYVATREALDLLLAAAAEHGAARVINVASIAGKRGQGWLAAYSATKAGVVAFTQALHGESSEQGLHATALCPAFVATPMTEFLDVDPDELIQAGDVSEAVRYLLRISDACFVPEIQLVRAGDRL